MNHDTTPSILVRERPDIWQRSLALATRLTGYEYAPKRPLPDGTIYACSGYSPSTWTPPVPPKSKTPEQIEEERKKKIQNEIEDVERRIKDRIAIVIEKRQEIEVFEKEIEDLRKKKEELENSLLAAPVVFVPEGTMEWLLHEVGHYVAATPTERLLPNYGLADDISGTVDGYQKIVVPADYRADREWGAWGFQEIVLAPFGRSRGFTPPTQRDGVAFAKAGPMSVAHLAHVEKQMAALGIDVEEWRVVYGQWIHHERGGSPLPSWERLS